MNKSDEEKHGEGFDNTDSLKYLRLSINPNNVANAALEAMQRSSDVVTFGIKAIETADFDQALPEGVSTMHLNFKNPS